MTPDPEILHATCVCAHEKGVLILGETGRGKSALALMMMGMGAQLVADDRVMLRREGAVLVAGAPPAIAGLIEARGIGILRADPARDVRLDLVVDLDQTETDRLPKMLETTLMSVRLPLFRGVQAPHFPAALMQYLRAGRISDGGAA